MSSCAYTASSLMVSAALKRNNRPSRVRSDGRRPGSNMGLTLKGLWHWLMDRNAVSGQPVPSVSRHGGLNGGSVKPSPKFSVSLVAVTEPPTFTLCVTELYVRSAFPPKFVKRRFCDTVAGISANGFALGVYATRSWRTKPFAVRSMFDPITREEPRAILNVLIVWG